MLSRYTLQEQNGFGYLDEIVRKINAGGTGCGLFATLYPVKR